MNRPTLILGTATVGLAVFGAGHVAVTLRRAADASAVAAVALPLDPAILIRPHSPILGPADAPVTIAEFFDPSCAACRAFHPVLQQIRETYPTQVRIVLRYAAFHEESDAAVRILEAARMQDKFEPVFLGFTACPDVCPTTLSDSSDWLDGLGADADRLNVVLISVDPERDTPRALADYLSNFDPRIFGLTRPLAQVELAASDFRATFEKVPQADGGYTMNHTSGVLLFRQGDAFGGIIDFHEDRKFAIQKIRRILT